MSTQYNAIQAPYDEWRKGSITLIERDNVHTAVGPFIENARVLDLACGSGFYSHHFVSWGAAVVVGVDISSAMLEQARQANTTSSPKPGQTKFLQQDCSKAELIDGGGFDLVFGAWLLNYAEDRAALVEMFRLIAMNLRDGGVFVGVTCVPTDDPADFIRREREVRPAGSGGMLYSVNHEVEGGVSFHVHADTVAGGLDFDCFLLRKAVLEEAAREAGMKGELRWSVTDVSDEFLERREGGASLEELESYRKVPHYGMIVLRK